METISNSIPWNRLLKEFVLHASEAEESVFQQEAFVLSLSIPAPPFVGYLLDARMEKGRDYGTAVRDLYFFLLRKRYEERLNLLHFAFCIFDDPTHLPKEIIDRTPFPHEDGLPRFGDLRVLDCRPPASASR